MAPAERPELARTEILIRGISTKHWDGDILDPGLFVGKEATSTREGSECSVSREKLPEDIRSQAGPTEERQLSEEPSAPVPSEAQQPEPESEPQQPGTLLRGEILDILRVHLYRPSVPPSPEIRLWGYAVLQAGNLMDWVAEFIQEKHMVASQVKVVADPTETPPPPNPAHALIAPRTTEGMSKRIISKIRERQEFFHSEGLPPTPEWVRAHINVAPGEASPGDTSAASSVS